MSGTDMAGIAAPRLSFTGEQMAAMSGLRSIMEDIATSTVGRAGTQWLNLSIGNPAPIPEVIDMWRRLSQQALDSGFAEASCQYGPSRGLPALVEAIADYFNARYGWGIGPENIIVGPGSQMLCFIAAALYAGPSAAGPARVVLPMVPDYTGYQGLCMDRDGITGVESPVDKDGHRSFSYTFDFDAIGRRQDIGVLLASSPSNPTGRCVTPAELASLTAIAASRGALLLLDHAYGQPFPQIGKTLVAPAFHPSVVNCFSLSKAGLPGERIGFAIGAEEQITPMVSFLANSALHASRLAQLAVTACLRSGEIDTISSSVIQPFYARRRALAGKLLMDAMPDDADWRLHSAEGGMFAWVWVNEDWFDDLVLYERLKDKGVFVAPGRSFFAGPARQGRQGTRCFRVTLSVPEGVLAEGIRRVGDTVRELAASR